MPFTVSHAAAALPLHAFGRGRLPVAALMVGSMAPDFAYFLPSGLTAGLPSGLPWGFDRYDTHSLPGLFTFSLPLGLVTWLFYVLLLERPTLSFLPDAWRLRIAPTAPPDLRALVFAAMAVLLGAASHLVWDSFTHSSTVVAEALPGLRDTLFDVDGIYVPVYFVLQVASSVLGLAVLLAWANGIRRWPELPRDVVVPGAAPRVTVSERMLALMFLCASAGAGACFNVARDGRLEGESALFYLLIGGMSGAAAGWCLLAVAIRFRSHPERWFARRDAGPDASE